MARDFSEDGAIGAASNTAAGAINAGSSAPLMPQPAQTGQNNANDTGLAGMAGGAATHFVSEPPDNNGFFSAPPQQQSSGPAMPTDITSQDTTGVTPWGRQFMQNTGGMMRRFAAGGAIDEDPNATDPQGSMMGANLQSQINQALQSVNNVMSYGRDKHGIGGGGQKQAMNTDGFRQSDNVEDRRDSDPTAGEAPASGLTKSVNSRMNELSGYASEAKAHFNPMSKDAGFNDVGNSQPQQAISTDEEPE